MGGGVEVDGVEVEEAKMQANIPCNPHLEIFHFSFSSNVLAFTLHFTGHQFWGNYIIHDCTPPPAEFT